MKLLKSHGKKISVMLLVTALMLAPILRVFADDTVTCEKRFHYYFLEAEELWIDTKTNSQDKIDRQYTDIYKQLFGITENDKNLGDNYNAPTITNGDIDTTASANYEVFGNSNGKVTFSAMFYNYGINQAYTTNGLFTTKNTWDKNDWKRYAKMFMQSVNVSSGEPTSSDVTFEEGDDIYFLHYAWKDGSGTKHENDSKYSDWQNSHDVHLLTTYFDDLAKYDVDVDTNSDVNAKIEELQKGSYAITTTVDADLRSVGLSSDAAITTSILRDFKTSESKTSLTNKSPRNGNIVTFKDIPTATEGKTDDYAWVLFPAMATVTFTATGDVCLTGSETTNTTITETSEENPNTGIASYAIIGTLLVGAASAYIYARKNNKFNKV